MTDVRSLNTLLYIDKNDQSKQAPLNLPVYYFQFVNQGKHDKSYKGLMMMTQKMQYYSLHIDYVCIYIQKLKINCIDRMLFQCSTTNN